MRRTLYRVRIIMDIVKHSKWSILPHLSPEELLSHFVLGSIFIVWFSKALPTVYIWSFVEEPRFLQSEAEAFLLGKSFCFIGMRTKSITFHTHTEKKPNKPGEAIFTLNKVMKET